MSNTLEVSNLEKHFGRIKAVDNVSFSGSEGEVLGFLGPNGAGKSTTMKIITGYLHASKGKVRVLGEELSEKSKQVIGYLPENSPMYGEMTVKGFLGFIAGVRKLESKAVNEVVELLDLSGVLEQRIETLSKGFKRRVGLAQAIVHDPPILILDEPTDGLDPNQKRDVRRVIREMSKTKTIVISTHILEEVASICTRAVIISKGRITADSTPAELMKESKYCGSVLVRLKGEVDKSELSGISKVKDVEFLDNGEIALFSDNPFELVDLTRERFKNNVLSISVSAGELTDVFYKYSN